MMTATSLDTTTDLTDCIHSQQGDGRAENENVRKEDDEKGVRVRTSCKTVVVKRERSNGDTRVVEFQ
jgi:hypothetical protein